MYCVSLQVPLPLSWFYSAHQRVSDCNATWRTTQRRWKPAGFISTFTWKKRPPICSEHRNQMMLKLYDVVYENVVLSGLSPRVSFDVLALEKVRSPPQRRWELEAHLRWPGCRSVSPQIRKRVIIPLRFMMGQNHTLAPLTFLDKASGDWTAECFRLRISHKNIYFY